MMEQGNDQTKLLGRGGDPQTRLKTEWPGLSTVFNYLFGRELYYVPGTVPWGRKKNEVGYWVRKTMIIMRSTAHV